MKARFVTHEIMWSKVNSLIGWLLSAIWFGRSMKWKLKTGWRLIDSSFPLELVCAYYTSSILIFQQHLHVRSLATQMSIHKDTCQNSANIHLRFGNIFWIHLTSHPADLSANRGLPPRVQGHWKSGEPDWLTWQDQKINTDKPRKEKPEIVNKRAKESLQNKEFQRTNVVHLQ